MAESTLATRLADDLKNSMKSGDKERLDTIRMLKANLQKILIDKKDFNQNDELSFLLAESKRRKEALELFNKGGREDLAKKEEAELAIIAEFLPKPMEEKELTRIIEETIKEVGASSAKDMGKVMSAVMPKVKGQADGKKIQEIVKSKLP